MKKGGRVVCAGIHMSDIPSFPYDILWEERQVMSVANLTAAPTPTPSWRRRPRRGCTPTSRPYPLEAANRALDDLRAGRLQGAAVLLP